MLPHFHTNLTLRKANNTTRKVIKVIEKEAILEYFLSYKEERFCFIEEWKDLNWKEVIK